MLPAPVADTAPSDVQPWIATAGALAPATNIEDQIISVEVDAVPEQEPLAETAPPETADEETPPWR